MRATFVWTALTGCGDDGGAFTTDASVTVTMTPAETTSETPTDATDPAPPTSATSIDADATDPIPDESSGESSSTGEPPPACASDEACAFMSTDCRVGVCDDGRCGYTPLPEGTLLPDGGANCRAMVCDASGSPHVIPDDADLPGADDPGNCKRPTCSGGNPVFVTDDADVPPADAPGNCKQSVCSDGQPAFVADDADLPTDLPGNCRQAICTAGQPGHGPDDADLPDDGDDCTADTCLAGEEQHPLLAVNTACGADDAQFCSAIGECQLCRQADATCDQSGTGEPNNNILLPTSLPAATGDDDMVQSTCGLLAGADDVDWYTFDASTGWFDSANPVVYTIAPEPHRTCMYVRCDFGDTMVDCVDDDTDATSFFGDPGCCGADNKVAPYINCDSARVYARIDNPGALACVGYELRWHF